MTDDKIFDKHVNFYLQRIRSLIDEGRGECIYDVGVPLGEFGNTSGGASSVPVDDTESQESNTFGLGNDDYMASVATLQSIAETLNADCVILREKIIDNERKAAQYLIRLRADEKVDITVTNQLEMNS